jgi:hypothetical protein
VNQFQPVRTRLSPLERHVRLLSVTIVAGLLLAVIKPWGGSGGSPQVTAVSPSPSVASPSPSPDIGFAGRAYDASIFGRQEPEAVWAIWPAGYLVTFGFVVQVPGVAAPEPAPSASRGPHAGRPAESHSPRPAAAGTDPSWPSVFDVPEGNHLLLIGINTPRGFVATTVALTRISNGNRDAPILIERQKSPWPDHFTVIGMPSESGDDLLKVWPPGRYRLDLAFDPGAISRSIEIRIAGPAGGPTAS